MSDNVAITPAGTRRLQFPFQFCRRRLAQTGVALCAVVCAAATLHADNPRQAFVKTWKGQLVVVKSPLYSLVYNERGKLGTTHSKREGLLVATSSRTEHLQFDGRQGRETVIAKDPGTLVKAVSAAYERDALDVRAYRKLEPLAIEQFVPGSELIVRNVQIERAEVTFQFDLPDGTEDSTTSLRIKWPLPLSPSFHEREQLESLVRQFVEIRQR